jgi:enoyl-CoA hydratase
MAYENIIFQVEGPVAVVKFNRPKAVNALNPDLMNEFGRCLEEIKAQPAIRVLVLTGEGEKAFVAGADIGYMSKLSPLEARRGRKRGMRSSAVFRASPFP